MQDQNILKLSKIKAGDLSLTFERTDGGIVLLSLFDLVVDRELLASQLLPIFSIKLRHVESKNEVELHSDSGWKITDIKLDLRKAILTWEQPDNELLSKLKVIACAELNDEESSISWDLQVENYNMEWSIMNVVFPQIAISELGESACIFFPRGPGEVKKGLWQMPFRHQGLYPEPWTVMQYVAAYDENSRSGIYIATHDPNASAKNIIIESRPEEQSVVFIYDHPSENMGIGGNWFELNGKAVWRIFRGNWFDAAMIYRKWLRSEAKWYPKISDEGNSDIPRWMRELCVWTTASGSSAQVVSRVREFAEFMGVPVGFHWYNWHQISFDNDYPHYFPVTDGFADGVR